LIRDFGVPSLSPGIIELRAKYRDEARMLPTQLQGKVIEEIEDEVED
jgi:hypothetical protein